ncbi:TIGR04283 family arsenosugar biosynthesis glycosyltransferase [Calothrix sp. PCC 6303]|uniref:TIGR04283 family arsenosugar biosynthesis glycosyltransferase n=1 Tax=Calothrix sp. PCC 6303 TaxID=1170562 RepID=UPI0002A04BDE|nr:glycosyl transferase family 2 [Calothrix sp. PCC 6303]
MDIINSQISVIIPVLNEAENIIKTIESVQLGKNFEIIVVDGGSQDCTVDIVNKLGINQILLSPPGRAVQMNAGAKIATGEILLFLHADTQLSSGFDVAVRETLEKPGIIAGAFTLRIDASSWGLRLIEWGVKMRSRFFQMPYGDQAIFITKQAFLANGGFPELPIMEDFELIRNLKKVSKIATVPVKVVTSPRRWLQKGIFKTTLINQIVVVSYFLGVSPTKIVHWYRGKKFRKF